VGAVIGMWLAVVSRCTIGYLFVVENSFIHTIMYAYYAAAGVGISVPFKFIITILQILQFVSGLTIGVVQTLVNSSCLTSADLFSFCYLESYVLCLLVLFVQFYQRTYRKKSKSC